MKTELWNGHELRFIEKDGDWWAAAADVCAALDIKNVTRALAKTDAANRAKCALNTMKGAEDPAFNPSDANLINELGIYQLIFKSRKKEAVELQKWVFGILKELRRAAGLEGFEVFRMLDKEKQKEAMAKLHNGLNAPIKVDYVKANTIANKAVSNLYGESKMVKKAEMSPQMLKDRQPILDDVVSLMTANEKFNLGVSVSEAIYRQIAAMKRVAAVS